MHHRRYRPTSKHSPLAWFYRLDRRMQADLLANPHGYLPDGVAAAIASHTVRSYRDEKPQESRLWQLRSAEANLLEDERLRLDRWWRELPDEARSALVMSRGGSVPRAWRAAVLDLHSDGLTPGTDLEAEFRMSGIAAAYIEMVATCCR
ncbi:hypothetical protein [Mycolicibacterium goodii]|uniref:hypothetical protein n=1 Tax=Mycolicibacterium goodii TaxID=134601 RepID=UPI001BDCE6F2|nr:hypothetical protein [Mycolicibacterium goodii]MBU8812735.1 hypothetical protein [Mycolicibacterium goodii]MBU8818610.1 hypothetical protein [Mycolicibacterium goodii]MBU8832141.1 hypothetical protein [Mycolicibacterium goodii]